MHIKLKFEGGRQESDNTQDWPVIDEAGYASLIRNKNSKPASKNRMADEPVYEKIQETNGFRYCTCDISNH